MAVRAAREFYLRRCLIPLLFKKTCAGSGVAVATPAEVRRQSLREQPQARPRTAQARAVSRMLPSGSMGSEARSLSRSAARPSSPIDTQ